MKTGVAFTVGPVVSEPTSRWLFSDLQCEGEGWGVAWSAPIRSAPVPAQRRSRHESHPDQCRLCGGRCGVGSVVDTLGAHRSGRILRPVQHRHRFIRAAGQSNHLPGCHRLRGNGRRCLRPAPAFPNAAVILTLSSALSCPVLLLSVPSGWGWRMVNQLPPTQESSL